MALEVVADLAEVGLAVLVVMVLVMAAVNLDQPVMHQ